MKGHGQKLTRKKEKAIGALLSETTIIDAAAVAGVSESTLRRWLKLPEFLSEYRTARRQVVEQAIAQLQQASGIAVESLISSVQSKSEYLRVKAALAILDHSYKGVEVLDFSQRIEDLESRLNN